MVLVAGRSQGLANLSAQLEGREQALLDELARQAEESAQFQVTRAPDEKP